MSRNSRHATLAFALLILGSCASAPDPQAQSLVETIASRNKDIVRLTVHAMPAGATKYEAVASTKWSKRGKPSDPEDLRAMQTGEVVVLDETDAIDVTVPIMQKGGKFTAAAGVTVKATVGRQAAMTIARSVATEIEEGMKKPAMK